MQNDFLLNGVNESALCIELKKVGLQYEKQKQLTVKYKGQKIGEFRIDLLIENSIVVELKSVERFDPMFEAQILSLPR